MKQRAAFLAFSTLFLFVLAPNALSIYEESFYSGTVNDGNIINISGIPFEFRIDSVSSKAYVAFESSALIIPSEECKTKGSFNVCIGNISFSYRNLTTYTDVYSTAVNIYQIKSKIDIKSAIETSNLLIDEEATAELAIENTADIVAKDVNAVINIPSNLLVIGTEGCKNSYSYIAFYSDVSPRQIKKCIYKLRGISGGDFQLTANVTFFDGVEKIIAAPDTLSGKVYNTSLKITPKLNKSRIDIGENFNFTIDVENINDQYELTVTNFNIKIPDNIFLVTMPRDTAGTGKIISWSGALAPMEKKSFVAELKSDLNGNYLVLTEAAYRESKFFRSANNQFILDVYCDCPYITHDFSGQITMQNQKTGLAISIVNPSRIYTFRDIKLNYFTNIPFLQNLPKSYDRIGPLETIKIFDSSITGPGLDETYNLNITAAYKSQANKVFFVKDDIIMKIAESKANKTEINNEIIRQQESKETNESKEITLGSAVSNKSINESGKEEVKQEAPVTKIEYMGDKPTKAFSIIAYAAIFAFILITLILFKKKLDKSKGNQQDAQKDTNKTEPKDKTSEDSGGIREFFSLISNKKKTTSEKSEKSGSSEKKDLDYEYLEKEINKLGDVYKKDSGDKYSDGNQDYFKKF